MLAAVFEAKLQLWEKEKSRQMRDRFRIRMTSSYANATLKFLLYAIVWDICTKNRVKQESHYRFPGGGGILCACKNKTFLMTWTEKWWEERRRRSSTYANLFGLETVWRIFLLVVLEELKLLIHQSRYQWGWQPTRFWRVHTLVLAQNAYCTNLKEVDAQNSCRWGVNSRYLEIRVKLTHF